MTTLLIETAHERTAYSPCETLAGLAGWELDKPATALELRLFFHTEGKGTQDMCIVNRVRFEHPGPNERRPFQFRLPSGPYSFSGKLISLRWGLELIVEPGKQSHLLDLIIAPGAKELTLFGSG
jgi:hypothetical protein